VRSVARRSASAPSVLSILHSVFCILYSAFFVIGCTTRAEPDYLQTILSSRSEKDRAFKESRESPLKPDQRAAFKGLEYFAPDESYRIAAALRVADENEQVVSTMPTSTGKVRQMRRVGSLEFNLKGQPLSLVAFLEDSESGRSSRRLFVPFSDLTSGTETYPAGRYLDLDATPTGLYDLDFNKAYNPYCAYNEVYDCPFPPKENRLNVAVRAGEKNYQVRSTKSEG
jgi:uncharacterized protein (DUF1684 family)